MSEIERKEGVSEHILTEQAFKQLILEKLERAKLQLQLKNREPRKELA